MTAMTSALEWHGSRLARSYAHDWRVGAPFPKRSIQQAQYARYGYILPGSIDLRIDLSCAIGIAPRESEYLSSLRLLQYKLLVLVRLSRAAGSKTLAQS